MSEQPGVQRTRLLRGKVLLMTDDLFAAIAPLCAAELARAEDGAYGTDGQQLVAYLVGHGVAYQKIGFRRAVEAECR